MTGLEIRAVKTREAREKGMPPIRMLAAHGSVSCSAWYSCQ
jgi:hypothetical protein